MGLPQLETWLLHYPLERLPCRQPNAFSCYTSRFSLFALHGHQFTWTSWAAFSSLSRASMDSTSSVKMMLSISAVESLLRSRKSLSKAISLYLASLSWYSRSWRLPRPVSITILRAVCRLPSARLYRTSEVTLTLAIPATLRETAPAAAAEKTYICFCIMASLVIIGPLLTSLPITLEQSR